MNGDKVVDIVRGEADYTGSIIETVFYKVSEIYAVYATDERVLVHTLTMRNSAANNAWHSIRSIRSAAR